MSLIILSKQIEIQENTFKNVALATLYSKLDFSSRENSLKENGRMEVWISKRFGNGEDDYDSCSMDIHEKEWCMNLFNNGKFRENEIEYYSLAGTDNTPSSICYSFSLHYLRLCPEHLISIYDIIFGLEDIEKIERNTGYVDSWLQKIRNK